MADDGFINLPPGKIANVVTFLEMVARPHWIDSRDSQNSLTLRRDGQFDLNRYRALFRAIGDQWLWSSRLKYDDAELSHRIHDADTELFEVVVEDDIAGMVELRRNTPQTIELAFFGLKPDFTGRGLGRDVMHLTLQRAWAPATQKVWLHTCTFDHPAALKFYQRCGFRPSGFAVEIMDDPRLTGLLPKSAGPHIPLLE